jgi:hypothetical protein
VRKDRAGLAIAAVEPGVCGEAKYQVATLMHHLDPVLPVLVVVVPEPLAGDEDGDFIVASAKPHLLMLDIAAVAAVLTVRRVQVVLARHM